MFHSQSVFKLGGLGDSDVLYPYVSQHPPKVDQILKFFLCAKNTCIKNTLLL